MITLKCFLELKAKAVQEPPRVVTRIFTTRRRLAREDRLDNELDDRPPFEGTLT
jgi:hypothetical protein